MNDQAFSPEQQDYLKGFMAGVAAKRGQALSAVSERPADLGREAQDRVIAAGGKLVAEEHAKRGQHPLDRMGEISAMAADAKFPKGTDVFLAKYHGLFYVAPAQHSYMCRLRIPGGLLHGWQLTGVAAIADELGGGYADVTTRANLQIRDIGAAAAPEVLTRLIDLGLTSRGAGADNVRNVTGSPTAGIDAQELIDTRPDTRRIHHHILARRELYGLPRKFNIAFDGGGAVPVLQDTNDIAFTAVEIRPGADVPPGVYYQLGLGGITGHRDFARATGIVVAPAETTPVCDAILRVFIAHGDRTNRARARLKYLLDAWGLKRFIAAVEAELGRPLARVAPEAIRAAAPASRNAHVGVHAQRQPGLCYLGVVLPVGRLMAAQMRGVADIAARFGSGTIRLTLWQNLLISDVPAPDVEQAVAALAALGLACDASPVRAGLVACTGNAGCKFSATRTKAHALELTAWLEARLALDSALNIHLTGCHHSCAQHFIADIGLLGARVEQGEDTVEGYDVHVGGGAGPSAAIGRLVRPAVPMAALPPLLLGLLQRWQAQRSTGESFQSWSARTSDAELAAAMDAAA